MEQLLALYSGMLRDQKIELTKEMRILDVGCGKGDFLFHLNQQGFKAKGTDIVSYGYNIRDDIKDKFTPIVEDPYHFSYEDNEFDFICSHSVVEHVQNTEEFFSEISRVLRPNGVSIHIFPSKYRFAEAHVKVPLGGMITCPTYYRLWAELGLKRHAQKGMSKAEIAKENQKLVAERTNYISRSKMHSTLKRLFSDQRNIEWSFLQHGYGAASRILSKPSQFLPLIPIFYSIFHTNVIYLRK